MTVHKFAVGQSVRFSPDRNQGVTVRGSFKVVRLLPEAASILQYRVKSQLDGHECVVAKTSSRGHEGASTMPTMSLKVTRPPSSAADHRPPELVKPLFRGNGDTDYLCGNCGSVMAAGLGPTQRVIVDAAVCSACGAENEFPAHLRA